MKKAARAAIVTILTLTTINTIEIITATPMVATIIGHIEANLYGGTYVRKTNTGSHIYSMTNMPGVEGVIATQRGNVTMIHKQYATAPDVIAHEHAHQLQFQRHGTFGTQLLAHYHILAGTIKYGDAECAYYNSPLEVEAYKVQFGPTWSPPKRCQRP